MRRAELQAELADAILGLVDRLTDLIPYSNADFWGPSVDSTARPLLAYAEDRPGLRVAQVVRGRVTDDPGHASPQGGHPLARLCSSRAS